MNILKTITLGIFLTALQCSMYGQRDTSNHSFHFVELEDSMGILMDAYKINGAAVAITENDRMVYYNCYGFMRDNQQEPFTKNSIVRLPVITDVIMQAAVSKFARDYRIFLFKKVFGKKGILGDDYGIPPKDSKISKITIWNLLNRRSGWEYIPDYPESSPKVIISDMVTNHPLKYAPGETETDGRFGFYVLREIISKITGMPYEQYVREKVLKPCGITDMQMVGPAFQEGESYDEKKDVMVTNRDFWVGSLTDLTKFMIRVDRNDDVKDIIKPRLFRSTFFDFYYWYMYGIWNNTSLTTVRLNNEFNYVLIIRRNKESKENALNAMDEFLKRKILERKLWPVYSDLLKGI
jgi:hypothetical protein